MPAMMQSSSTGGQHISICTATDEFYLPGLVGMVRSLQKELPVEWTATIYVLHTSVSAAAQHAANQDMSSKHISVQWLSLPSSIATVIPATHNMHVTAETYYRLFLADLLPKNLQIVLYVDVDVVFVDQVDSLWNTDISDVLLAAVPGMYGNTMAVLAAQGIQGNFSETDPYFNAGVLLINLQRWRQEQAQQEVLELLHVHAAHVQYDDQCLLNILCAGRWKLLDSRWNVCATHVDTYIASGQSPGAIHFNGIDKPWIYWHLSSEKRSVLRYKDGRPVAANEIAVQHYRDAVCGTQWNRLIGERVWWYRLLGVLNVLPAKMNYGAVRRLLPSWIQSWVDRRGSANK